MKNRTSLALAFLALVSWSGPAVASASRTISVTGTAVTRVVPDTVVWSVVTTSTNPKLVRAKEQSDRQMKSVLRTVQELGVKSEDVQTGHLRVDKEYERTRHGHPQKFRHFRVTREVSIKQRGTDRFDAFLTGLVKSTEMTVRYTLESSKIDDIRAQTRLSSVAIAKKKAGAMAKVLGATLGPVLTVNEGGGGGYRPQNIRNEMHLEQGFGGAGAFDGSTGTFAPGAIEVRSSVGAVFELR